MCLCTYAFGIFDNVNKCVHVAVHDIVGTAVELNILVQLYKGHGAQEVHESQL